MHRNRHYQSHVDRMLSLYIICEQRINCTVLTVNESSVKDSNVTELHINAKQQKGNTWGD